MMTRPSVSRVRGAACNGVDHAGESPVAAIARFGCVAMPDVDGGRPPTAQAQVKVLGAAVIGPTRQEGERILGPQRERTPCEASRWLSTRNGSWSFEQPSPSRKGEGQWTIVKATGQRNGRLLRRIGGGTRRMVDDPKQGRSRAGKVSRSRGPRFKPRGKVVGDHETGGSGRSSDDAEGQHNPGRAKDPWGSDVLDDAKVDPTCPAFRANGRPPPCSEGEHYGCIKPGDYSLGQVASEGTVRSRCLEAVLGKTRRTEFQRGDWKRELRTMLNGHEAGNGGHCQASTYEPPRLPSTQQIRTHGLKGVLAETHPAVGEG